MCKNLELYNKVCQPPQEALKAIQAGRLKGKTDINPMWRIKELTRQFGPCGVGWNLINHHWQYIPVGDKGETVCLCEVDLIYRLTPDSPWSEPVHGIGGNMLASIERNGLYVDDDGPKKAYSDAIGTACKALGFAANVYWEKDPTKYSGRGEDTNVPASTLTCVKCGKAITPLTLKSGGQMSASDVAQNTQKIFGFQLCAGCWEEAKRASS